MNNKKYFIFIFFMFPILALAGPWQIVGGGIDSFIKYIYNDSVTNTLYVSGNLEFAGGINVNQIASWNGTNWDSLGPGMHSGSAGYGITRFQNNLYLSGLIYNDFSHFFGKWNGTNWDTTGLQVDGATGAFEIYNGKLILGGNFNTAGSQNSKFIAGFDGTSWTQFPTSTWAGGGVYALANYNGELYCAGGFYDNANSISRLCKWNGTMFIPIGNLSGGLTAIACMKVYNNELYIGGYFTPSMGAAGNYIMKWDGVNLASVGQGVNSTVRCMEVFNNELFIGGDFDSAGSVKASRLAKWDGIQWSAVTTSSFDAGINAITFFQNQLYVAGGFQHIDMDSVLYFARWDSITGIATLNRKDFIELYPNPSSDFIHLKFLQPVSSLRLKDILGHTLFEAINVSSKNYEIDISNFSAGLYFIFCDENKPIRVLKN